MNTTFGDEPDIEEAIVDKLAEATSTCKCWKPKKESRGRPEIPTA